MHEGALLSDLRSRIEQIAASSGAKRVVSVTLWVRALSHVTESHLREDRPRVVQGTPADRAALEIETSDDVTDARPRSVVVVRIRVP